MKDYLSNIAERVFGRDTDVIDHDTSPDRDIAPLHKQMNEQTPDNPDLRSPDTGNTRTGDTGTGDTGTGDTGIGYLPGDISEKLRRYEPLKARPDAEKLLAQGIAVGKELQLQSISTAQSNRTKQIYRARKRAPR